MLLAMFAVTGLTALAAVAIVGHRDGAFVGGQPVRAARGTSPVDEAGRILAHRYAKGEITAEEYDRMLMILRR
ncbi:MAG TPA: SHOCT domain-containing protein [Coriobacteriia bacterium]